MKIGRHVPIGLAYLASSLRAAGHEVMLFDALAHTEDNHIVNPERYTAADRVKVAAHPHWRHLVQWGADWSKLDDIVRTAAPDVVGVSCMFTPYYETAYEACRRIKDLSPVTPVLLGGQHPTVAWQHALAEPAVDIVVRGEAERTLVDVLDALSRSEALTAMPGLAFRCGRGFCRCDAATQDLPVESSQPQTMTHATAAAPQIADLDALPLPASDLLDFDRYAWSTTLITSRGCPFSCTFCTVHATVGKAFRARSPQLVVDEIRHLVEVHGVRQFRIEDDNFTFDIERVRALCAAIRESGLDVELHLPNGMTVVKLSRDLVEDMVSAGFRSLFLGLETTDRDQLLKIRKGFTSLDKVTEAASWFDDADVKASASLIVGLLGQTNRHAANDATRLASSGIAFDANPFYPIPGSTDYTRCESLGLIDASTELALFEGFNFSVGSDRMSPDDMYWSWVLTQAQAYWPSLIMTGPARSGQIGPWQASIEALIAHNLSGVDQNAKFERLASPISADGDLVTVAADGCFCFFQEVRELRSGGGPIDFCTATGDIIAAAVGQHSGVPMSATQVSSRVHRPGDACRFRLAPTSPPAAAAPFEAFLAALRSGGEPSAGRQTRSLNDLVVQSEGLTA